MRLKFSKLRGLRESNPSHRPSQPTLYPPLHGIYIALSHKLIFFSSRANTKYLNPEGLKSIIFA